MEHNWILFAVDLGSGRLFLSVIYPFPLYLGSFLVFLVGPAPGWALALPDLGRGWGEGCPQLSVFLHCWDLEPLRPGPCEKRAQAAIGTHPGRLGEQHL